MTLTAHFDLTDADAIALTVSPRTRLERPVSELCMSLVHPLEQGSLQGARLLERQGDWHRLGLLTPWYGETPLTIAFTSQALFKKHTDAPYGLYAMAGERALPIDLETPAIRRFVQPKPIAGGRLHWLPTPDHCRFGDRSLACPETLALIGEGWNRAWLQRLCARLSPLPVPRLADDGYPLRAVAEPGLGSAFSLVIERAGLELRYRDAAGFQCGQAYAMQFLVQWPLAGALPESRLSGAPRFDYRGVHLDVVRHFFAAETVQEWFDILALFQFNRFHWHLTDDDGWRVESDAYPELTEIGAWRGHGLALPPQMGSGPEPYGGCYTKEQVRLTVARAESLGITVIPEMDVPGHARALLKALPRLVETADASRYRSVQHYDDNVLNPALPETAEVLRTLIDEWCELFTGPWFHLGSDEVPPGAWLHSPAAQAWGRRHDRSPADLHGVFMGELEAVVQCHGKTAMGWEEIRTGAGVSQDTWVLSWQGVEAGRAAAEAGHPVVMTPAQSCYLDLALSPRRDDPGYYWAGTVDLARVWRYDPTAGLGPEAAARIQGVQACLWTELVTTPEQAEFMWFPRLLAMAEVGWGGNRDGEYDDFERRAGHWAMVLAHLGVRVRDPSLGW